MSIGSLTTLAAAREDRQPRKGDIGRALHGTDAAAASASMKDALVAQVPTELVAPYTALTAAIVGQVSRRTPANPSPDQLAIWRWVAFGILVIGIVGFVYQGKVAKSANTSFPILAVSGALVAGVGWAFALPGGPLTPYLHSKAALTIVPLVVGFAAIVGAGLTASQLKNQKGKPNRADA
jgi:hypothetical protein